MIRVEDTVTCRLSEGGKLNLGVGDRVLADPTCGQWENGWWLVDERQVDYFLNDEGILYAEGDDEKGRLYQTVVGYHVPSARKSRDFERMINAMCPDFTCGTEIA